MSDAAPSTREQILALAQEYLLESGPAGFEVKELARRGWFHQSQINYYFGSKQGLLAEAANAMFAAVFSLRPPTPASGGSSGSSGSSGAPAAPAAAPVVYPMLATGRTVKPAYLVKIAGLGTKIKCGSSVRITVPKMYRSVCRVKAGKVIAISTGVCGARSRSSMPRARSERRSAST